MGGGLNNIIEGVLARKPLAIARAISLVENREADALPLLKSLFSETGRAEIIGVTGAPGAGKSTLVDRLAAHYRAHDQLVGIIAVDPSSPFSGGALLGDRIRMQTLGTDPGVFIRSMATRGNLGGLAATTVDVVSILDAAGYQKILVETVGVGQDEIDIVKTADVVSVVLVPGMGDEIQTIKAGIMEIGDVFVINKADRDGVERLEQGLHALLELTRRPDQWTPMIVKTIATQNKGIDRWAAALASYAEFRQSSEQAAPRRQQIAEQRLVTLLGERLLSIALSRGLSNGELSRLAQAVVRRERDPYSIVEEITSRIL
ncbi:MAG: methylmalonyl Co-A mutase-associated GTPase MeaB [Acidobacteriota bacterium]|nr:methylmalonyl Co-A mutase-associated GTPase MeaB [Blastocatellia bacterium]MDW8239968.1 methylmalonyl Co-A mutase-associated GTPase MeaB [Acidobacteriota bacterium]